MSPEMINGLFALGGATIGAVLTGGISWYQAKRNAKKKELTVLTSRTSRLIRVDSSISEVVTITISGQSVPSVYTFDITLVNSGNETLNDIKVSVKIEGKASLVTADIGSANFTYNPKECTAKKVDDFTTEVSAIYLNPSDELVAKVLLTEKPESIKSCFRQPGVRFIARDNYDPTTPDVFTRTMFEAIRKNFLLHSYMRLALPAYDRYIKYEKESKNKDT